jgi:PAS domain S-box-containing protein
MENTKKKTKIKKEKQSTRVLIVEDEHASSVMLENMLRKGGYEIVASVESGEEAIEAAGRETPDLVLMDIQLSGTIDGIEAASRIQQEYGIPFLYLTSGTDDDQFNRAKASMPVGYILKPYSFNMLHASIEMALHRYQVEKELTLSEQRNRALLDAIPDIMFTINPDGSVKDRVQEEIARKVWPGAVARKASGMAQKVLETGEVETFEYALKKEDDTLYYEVRLINSKDDTILAIVRNITAKKKAELELQDYKDHLEELAEKRARELMTVNRNLEQEVSKRREYEVNLKTFRHALEQSPNVVVIVNREGVIEYVNPTFEHISGFSAEDTVGRSVKEPDNHVIPEPDTWEYLIKKDKWYGDLYAVNSDDQIYYLYAYVSHLRDENNDITHYIIVAEDVTDQRRRDMELKKAREIIDQSDIIQIDKDMEWQEWKEKMMSRNISRTDKSLYRNIYNSFTQGAGFGALISLLDMMDSTSKKEDGTYQVDGGLYSEIMKNVSITQDAFKTFSNIDWIIANDFEPEQINLEQFYEFIRATVDKNEELSRIKGQKIILNDLSVQTGGKYVNVNREYMYKAVNEALINAMKFSRPRTYIIVLMNVIGVNLALSIINDPEKSEEGFVGIPPEYEKVVFEPFYRLTKNVYERFGTLDFGLGLSLIEKIVTKHGGEVTMNNILDHSDIKRDPITKVNLTIALPLVIEKK